MLGHDPEEEPPDDAVEDRVDERDHLAGLLELTDEFFRQASPQVRAELLDLTQQRSSAQADLQVQAAQLAVLVHSARLD